jgi:hypothetical protein
VASGTAAVDAPVADGWWPGFRTIDRVGVGSIVAFALWVWWSSRATGGEGGPLIVLLLAIGVVAALTRWATFFHGTLPPALLVAFVVAHAFITGDGFTGDGAAGASAEVAGAVLTVGVGAAALVVLRTGRLWVRLLGGLAVLGLAVLTWRSGSLTATVVAATTLVATALLLVLPMRERRWLVVWPALVAVLLLLGTMTYASLPLSNGDLTDLDPARVDRWELALEVAGEEPLYGLGRGTSPGAIAGSGETDWVRHEPLQVTADTGIIGGVLLLLLVWWALAWIARPGGGPGSIVAGVVVAGSLAHACLAPVWHEPVVPLTLAALAGAASLRGGDASWRLARLRSRAGAATSSEEPAAP